MSEPHGKGVFPILSDIIPILFLEVAIFLDAAVSLRSCPGSPTPGVANELTLLLVGDNVTMQIRTATMPVAITKVGRFITSAWKSRT